MSNERDLQIRRLQQNLSSIRKIAGWTAEMLGDKIGVTKQTISNLENRKTPMNFTQYIAIRSVLDYEIEHNKENEVLPKVIALLLDSGDEFDDENYSKVQDVADTVAASAIGGTPTVKLDKVFDVLIASLSFIIPVAGVLIGSSTGHWKKLLK
ncbi:MAG: helix-turn-helix transcriptional regulator [Oscillospiraceae bacterium]|jgi:DNA-binding XRE family transcriptional regulator|nr:helix-turn-helix transcriptional regulator [Oscillospiraceae bacterium]